MNKDKDALMVNALRRLPDETATELLSALLTSARTDGYVEGRIEGHYDGCKHEIEKLAEEYRRKRRKR